MMKQKITAPILFILIALFALAACGDKGKEEASGEPEPAPLLPTAAAAAEFPTVVPTVVPAIVVENIPDLTNIEESAAWMKIQSEGHIVVGTAVEYAPFEFYNDNFQIEGFDIALMNAIAREMGVTVEFRDMAFDSFGDALFIGQIDLAISAIPVTPERAQIMNFSNIYLETNDSIAAAADSPMEAARLDHFVRYHGGVQTGSVYEGWLKKNLVESGLIAASDLSSYETISELIDALNRGDVEYIMLDKQVIDHLMANGEEFSHIMDGLYTHRFAIGMGKDELHLQAAVNRALAALQANGTVAQLAAAHLRMDTFLPIQEPYPLTDSSAPIGGCHDGMEYMADVTYDDDGMRNLTEFMLEQPFKKTWQIRNAGGCTWTTAYRLVYASGNKLSAYMNGSPINLPKEVAPGGIIHVTVPLASPFEAGIYHGIWELRDADDKGVGDHLSVGITVSDTPPLEPAPSN